MAAREADKWAFLPPGGESYEHAVRARVAAGSATLDRDRPWSVAHGGVGRVAVGAHLLGIGHRREAVNLPISRRIGSSCGTAAEQALTSPGWPARAV